MRFALVNNIRLEAEPDLNGICPVCEQPVFARCGDQKIHHWAHKSKKDCDHWWESETEWHRSWKDCFPNNWQEYLFTDEKTGEKHIADIYTEHGLVIEFQHSHIKHEECISREKFYPNMVWVIDGTRLKNDYKRFLREKGSFRPIANMQGFFGCFFPREIFPEDWVKSSVPVIFDFLGLEEAANLNDPRKPLYCLFPQRIGGEAVFAMISRKKFINLIIDGKFSYIINKYFNELNQKELEREKEREEESRRQEEKFKQQEEEHKKQEILNKKLRGKNSKKPRFSDSSYVPPWELEYYWGDKSLKEGRYSDATDFFKNALELNTYPENKTYIKSAIAKACKKSGNLNEAEGWYKDILQKEPDNLYIQTALASVYRLKKDYIRCINLYKSILKLVPEYEQAQKGLALAYKYKESLSLSQ